MDMGARNLGCAVLALLTLVARTEAKEGQGHGDYYNDYNDEDYYYDDDYGDDDYGVEVHNPVILTKPMKITAQEGTTLHLPRHVATLATLAGPVGAGRSIQFHDAYDKGLLTHSGGLQDGPAGGDPHCCERCRKEFEKGGSNPRVWGRTDMYNYKWDNKYNFNSCTCYAGPSDPEKLAQIGVSNDGPVAGYCGNDASFADITLGEDVTFFYESVEDLGWAWGAGSSDECCEKCKNEFPGSDLFEFAKYNKYCICYKSIPGTRPETYGEGYYAGVCTN